MGSLSKLVQLVKAWKCFFSMIWVAHSLQVSFRSPEEKRPGRNDLLTFRSTSLLEAVVPKDSFFLYYFFIFLAIVLLQEGLQAIELLQDPPMFLTLQKFKTTFKKNTTLLSYIMGFSALVAAGHRVYLRAYWPSLQLELSTFVALMNKAAHMLRGINESPENKMKAFI